MTSFCVQYLSQAEAGHGEAIVGTFFMHEEGLEDVAHRAEQLSAEFGEARAFRILDMGGGVHVFRVLDT